MAGTGFCPGCGAPTTPLTEICTRCGVRLADATRGKTWKTKTAGILAIVAGAVGVTVWVGVAVLYILRWGWLAMADLLGGLGGFLATVLAIVITITIVAIVGGIFALKRRRWRLALAGSICAVFSSPLILLTVPLGIAAIVLVVLGRGEFEQSPRLRGSCKSDLKGL
jgi:hypothetical protein